jgi:hypothetical protein
MDYNSHDAHHKHNLHINKWDLINGSNNFAKIKGKISLKLKKKQLVMRMFLEKAPVVKNWNFHFKKFRIYEVRV